VLFPASDSRIDPLFYCWKAKSEFLKISQDNEGEKADTSFMYSLFVFLQRRGRGKVLSAAVAKALGVQWDVQVGSFDVPVPGPFRIEMLAAGVARERQLKVVSLGHVGQQRPLGTKLLPAVFARDRPPPVPVLGVEVISSKKSDER
jgi:hypothetical protein